MNSRKNSVDRIALPGRRKITDLVVRTLCLVATLLALVPLLSLLQFVIVRGAGGLSWDLLTQLPRPVGEPGGGRGRRCHEGVGHGRADSESGVMRAVGVCASDAVRPTHVPLRDVGVNLLHGR